MYVSTEEHWKEIFESQETNPIQYIENASGHAQAVTRPPVDRTYLDRVQMDLYETIKKAEDSWDPSVSLAGIAILAKYEKLVDLILDIKQWGLNDR
jgi:hypothetical protein